MRVKQTNSVVYETCVCLKIYYNTTREQNQCVKSDEIFLKIKFICTLNICEFTNVLK